MSSRSPNEMAWVGHTWAHAGSLPTAMRSAQNVHLWIAGTTRWKSNFGTTNGHACMQYRQPMQRHELKTTGPSGVFRSAVVGHAEAQAGSTQCMHKRRPKTQSGWPFGPAATPEYVITV